MLTSALPKGIRIPSSIGIRQPNNPELYPDTNVTVATDGQGNAVHPFDGTGPARIRRRQCHVDPRRAVVRGSKQVRWVSTG
jgi:hypothetical protein